MIGETIGISLIDCGREPGRAGLSQREQSDQNLTSTGNQFFAESSRATTWQHTQCRSRGQHYAGRDNGRSCNAQCHRTTAQKRTHPQR